MNSPSFISRSHTVDSRRRRPLAGFTLIEMLVVITIIGILAGLVTAAALAARRAAKNATIVAELKGGLDAACVEYKNQFGEYPPDFAGLKNVNTDPNSKHKTPFFGIYQTLSRNTSLACLLERREHNGTNCEPTCCNFGTST
jgi:prepilin-type N-terminal cleavage/methylation domain-containing protein